MKMIRVKHKTMGWIEVFPHTKEMLEKNNLLEKEEKEEKTEVKTKEEKRTRKTK